MASRHRRARGGRCGRHCGLYLDQAHNFFAMPGSLEDVLAEARAYGLGDVALGHETKMRRNDEHRRDARIAPRGERIE
jgi:hypothetical protein